MTGSGMMGALRRTGGVLRQVYAVALQCWQTTRLYLLRRRLWKERGAVDLRVWGYSIRHTDGRNLYIQLKDEFVRQVYSFSADRPDPRIIDGGSNTGLSILNFKRQYPAARIIGFEPDPTIFSILSENLERNGIQGVQLVNSGLAAEAGTALFAPDGKAGGRVGEGSVSVRLERLSDYLAEPVDFLKLNIEGEELPVLQEAAASGKLRNVREMVIEYHGWPEAPQRLGPLLDLLEEQGFRYLVHDFDEETCRASKPPFTQAGERAWFCLVYGRRTG